MHALVDVENSSWSRKLVVQKRRATLNDFERFQLMLAKIKKVSLVNQELATNLS